MSKLINFFLRYHASFLFIALEIFAFILIFNTQDLQRQAMLNSSNGVTAWFHNQTGQVQEYFHLRRLNDSLLEENVRLKNHLNDAKEFYLVGSDSVKDTIQKQIYSYSTAKVVKKSTSRPNNMFTINKGSADGIKQDMGVISAKGIVGVVRDVSQHFSTVTPVIHREFRLTTVVDSLGYLGQLRWQGRNADYAALEDIPPHVGLAKGLKIYTTGYSSIFPAGIEVGKITSFEKSSKRNFYDVEIKLATDFHKLQYVYVVDYLYKEERKKLEELSDAQ